MLNSSTKNILFFPDEILLEVLHYLDGHALFLVACVCTKLRALVFDRSFEHKWGLKIKKYVDVNKSISGLMVLDDERVVIGSRDKMVHIWNWVTSELKQEFQSTIGPVYDFQLLEDGDIACRSSAKSMFIYNPVTSNCRSVLKDPNETLTCSLLFKNYLITGNEPGNVSVWDLLSGECKQVFKDGVGMVTALTTTVTGELVCGYWSSQMIVFDLETGGVKYLFDKYSYNTQLTCLKTIRKGYIAAAFDNGLLCIFNQNTYACEHEIQAHDSRINCLLVTARGNVLSGSTDNKICHWNVATGECKQIMKGHKKPVVSLKEITEDYFVSSSADKTLRVWNCVTGECEYSQPIIHLWPFCLVVSSGGNILCGSTDGVVTQLNYYPKPQYEVVSRARVVLDDQAQITNVNSAEDHDNKIIRM